MIAHARSPDTPVFRGATGAGLTLTCGPGCGAPATGALITGPLKFGVGSFAAVLLVG